MVKIDRLQCRSHAVYAGTVNEKRPDYGLFGIKVTGR
jgi:hypothetical protein